MVCELVDDFIDMLGEFGRYINEEVLPRVLHPVGFSNCYNRMREIRESSDPKLDHWRALYHTRNQTEFYRKAQV